MTRDRMPDYLQEAIEKRVRELQDDENYDVQFNIEDNVTGAEFDVIEAKKEDGVWSIKISRRW